MNIQKTKRGNMIVRFVCLACISLVCLTTLSGCSSPFLPHNAWKYIPEFSRTETTENSDLNEDLEQTEQGETIMSGETLSQHKSYFSPESIRERYAQHIENYTESDNDLLLDIAGETINLMQQEGKTNDEIRAKLIEKFHFSDETIDELLKK